MPDIGPSPPRIPRSEGVFFSLSNKIITFLYEGIILSGESVKAVSSFEMKKMDSSSLSKAFVKFLYFSEQGIRIGIVEGISHTISVSCKRRSVSSSVSDSFMNLQEISNTSERFPFVSKIKDTMPYFLKSFLDSLCEVRLSPSRKGIK